MKIWKYENNGVWKYENMKIDKFDNPKFQTMKSTKFKTSKYEKWKSHIRICEIWEHEIRNKKNKNPKLWISEIF